MRPAVRFIAWLGLGRARIIAMFLFGSAFQPQQRISGAFLQSAAEQDAHEPTSPTAWETKIAMVVDATSPLLKRNAVHRLVNRQAK